MIPSCLVLIRLKYQSHAQMVSSLILLVVPHIFFPLFFCSELFSPYTAAQNCCSHERQSVFFSQPTDTPLSMFCSSWFVFLPVHSCCFRLLVFPLRFLPCPSFPTLLLPRLSASLFRCRDTTGPSRIGASRRRSSMCRQLRCLVLSSCRTCFGQAAYFFLASLGQDIYPFVLADDATQNRHALVLADDARRNRHRRRKIIAQRRMVQSGSCSSFLLSSVYCIPLSDYLLYAFPFASFNYFFFRSICLRFPVTYTCISLATAKLGPSVDRALAPAWLRFPQEYVDTLKGICSYACVFISSSAFPFTVLYICYGPDSLLPDLLLFQFGVDPPYVCAIFFSFSFPFPFPQKSFLSRQVLPWTT